MSGLLAAGTPVAWLIARAAGLVAFALLTVSVTLGLMMSTRLLAPRRQKELLGWHQTLLWTALAMLVLHASAIVLDPVLRFGLPQVLIPGAAPWRPYTIAAGIVAGYLMLALALSFRVRRRIGQRRWRLLHYASFGAFGSPSATGCARNRPAGHGGLVFAGIALAPVLWLTYARILVPRAAPRPRAARAAPGASARYTSGQRRCRRDRRPAHPRVVPGDGHGVHRRRDGDPSPTTRARQRALNAARREIESCEQALSRFRGGSDLSRVNAAGGAWTPWTTTGSSMRSGSRSRVREETTGRFDRRCCPALVAAGYDRSVEQLNGRPSGPRPTAGGRARPSTSTGPAPRFG